MRGRGWSLVAVLVTLAVATGCGDEAPVSSAATTPPAPPPPGPLVALERGGGLTGAVVGMEVARSGRVVPRPRGRRLRLGSDELATLRRELRAARLPPRGEGSTPPVVPDAFVYVISAGGRSVTFGVDPPPTQVRPLAAHLQRLLRRTGAG